LEAPPSIPMPAANGKPPSREQRCLPVMKLFHTDAHGCIFCDRLSMLFAPPPLQRCGA
jgi:hypothetical protein